MRFAWLFLYKKGGINCDDNKIPAFRIILLEVSIKK